MKRIVMSLVACTLAGSGFAECTYSLNASQNQVTQIDKDIKLFPINSGQKIGFILQSTQDFVARMALSSTFANTKIQAAQHSPEIVSPQGDVILATTGVVAFELKFKVPTNTLNGNERAGFFPIQTMGRIDDQSGAGVWFTYANNLDNSFNKQNYIGIHVAYMTNGSVNTADYPFDVQSTPDGFQRVGVYINQDQGKIGYIFNGSDQGYFPYPFPKLNNYSFLFAGGYANIANNSANLGKEISVELVTDHSKLQFTYPSGTKDICGNAL
ncbi:hypothetical protein A7A69_04085 [Acinetobacter sp. Ac_1271]|nr:hypothetical protein [Acinetobacter guerrae]